MKTAKITYQGNLRNQITHLASGETLLTDGPRSSGGKDESISPSDLLAAAVASCAMTVIAIRAENLGADFSGCYAETEKEVDMQQFRLTKLRIDFYLKAEFSSEVRQAMENALPERCVVGRSLSADVEQEFVFHYQ